MAIFLFTCLAFGQLPDAPSQLKKCGPKWLGGCYNYDSPKPTNREVLKDPVFLWPTVGQWTAVAFDMAATEQGLHNGSGCVERNQDLGPHPSLGRLIGVNLAIDGAVTGIRFVMLKAIPRDSHGKGRRVVELATVGMASYSMYVHTKGGSQWFSSGCM